MNAAARQTITVESAATIRVAGEVAYCDPRGALYFASHRLLVVSDLHLEKGSALARRGVLAPPYDTAATLLRLAHLLADHAPRTVISLGDSFHDRQGAAGLHDAARQTLSSMMAGRDWYWVTGNHDPDPPAGIAGESVGEIAFGPLVFRHEPSAQPVEGEIAGHLHPCARIVQRGRSVRRRCFASDGQRLIMPALAATQARSTCSIGLMPACSGGKVSWPTMLGQGRVYPISGAMLRPG